MSEDECQTNCNPFDLDSCPEGEKCTAVQCEVGSSGWDAHFCREVLDGGQLAMLTAERIRGRPLPESVQAGLQWAGFIMLVALMVFVVANDIRNL